LACLTSGTGKERVVLFRLTVLLATLLFSMLGVAQPYPSRPVRLVVSNAAGGPTDFVARVLAQRLSESLSQPVVVENRIGAGGIVGTDHVAKAVPDGYTLMVSAPGPLVITPHLNTKLPYDVARDFVPVAAGPTSNFLLIVPPTLPAKSLPELLSLARTDPGKLNYASAGIGTPPHMAVELLKRMAGIDVVHVPYKGVPQAEAAVMSGEVAFMFDTLSAINLARAGKVRAIAVSALIRSSLAPEVPTVAEAAVPGFDMSSWYGVFAPIGTPNEIVLQLNRAIRDALQHTETKNRFLFAGYEMPADVPAAEFGAFVSRESVKWRDVIRAAGIKAE
jgi:tripartite-type tricarboxylate transporter receptor subunit TctC